MSNLSKLKREKLIEKLNVIRESYIDDDDMRKVLNTIEAELTSKKYGLLWEEHAEKVNEVTQTKIPVFKEVKSKEISLSDDEYNFLLEGDNLYTLQLLQKTHKRKIDVIYIDPPYNTGSQDFTYDDKRIDKEDGYRHSKWLSFMNIRLRLAQKLLTNEGFIFISIDDNELYQLKLLCDEIFGSDNFIANMIVASNSTKNNSKFISVSHEYILCYAKNKSMVTTNWKVKKNYANEFELRAKRLLNMGLNYKEIHNELLSLVKYPRFYDFDHYTYADEFGVYRTDNAGGVANGNFETEIIHPITQKKCAKPSGGWRYKDSEIQSMLENNMFHFGDDETVIPVPKRYLHDYMEQTPKSTLFFDSQTSTKWLKKRKIDFDFAKPIDLIKHILSIFDKDVTVLDFFAGSGTTAHAVLEMNKADSGNRKFILCTNNEVNDEKAMKYFKLSKKEFQIFNKTEEYKKRIEEPAYQSLGICQDITYKRLKCLIDEGMATNLKYYKTDFVSKDNADYLISDNLLDYISEMIQLEHHITIDNKTNVILLNEDEVEQLCSQITSNCKRIYKDSTIMFDSITEKKLKKLDIEVINIPERYFSKELREVGEL